MVKEIVHPLAVHKRKISIGREKITPPKMTSCNSKNQQFGDKNIEIYTSQVNCISCFDN